MISEFKGRMNHSYIYHLHAHQGMMGNLYPQQLQVQSGQVFSEGGEGARCPAAPWLGRSMEDFAGLGGKHTQA